MEEKTMYIANFNITFGKKAEPMLNYFSSVIYPAFCSNYTIEDGKEDTPKYSLSAVKLEKYNNEYVLVGNFIKDTQYKVITTKGEKGIEENPQIIPTAPYSRFIIFLKNHRMILIKNEQKSPDIRSFQAIVRKILVKYRGESKKQKAIIKIPTAIVNIVEMKLREDIATAFKNIAKIEFVKVTFFPLNNDGDFSNLSAAVNAARSMTSTKHPQLVFPSPKSKEGVATLVSNVAEQGLAITHVKGIDNDGAPITIKDDNFTTSKKVICRGNLIADFDEYLIGQAQKNKNITYCSKSNEELYNLIVDKIEEII